MKKKSVSDIDVSGKKVLVRVDFNVPLSHDEANDALIVADDTRIRAALPTIHYLLEQNAAVILCSHLGRPKSAADTQFRMDPVAKRLQELLNRPVLKIDDVVGERVTAAASALQPGQVMLLENTRFEPGEKSNAPQIARELAQLADVYVNDAFGSAHRAHASTEGVAQAMHTKGGAAVAGFLMEKELKALGLAVDDPPHPYVAIMGGAKISDKIKLIENLLKTADKVLVGGGMANTFLKAQNHEVGKSLVEEDALPEARRLMQLAPERLILPVDVVVASEISAEAWTETVPVWSIAEDKMALDIGPDTLELFNGELQGANLVVWNGPMGVFEYEPFAAGTTALAHLLGQLVGMGVTVIVGGGDSVAAVNNAGLGERMSHVSTGGGASLELLEGKILPGIAALDDK